MRRRTYGGDPARQGAAMPALRPMGMTERGRYANPSRRPAASMDRLVAPRVNRLCRVADIARRLTNRLAARSRNNPMFLLSNQVPQLPARAVTINYGLRPAERLQHLHGQPPGPRRGRARLLRSAGSGSHPTIGNQTKRGRKPWTSSCCLVEERRAKWWPWKDVFEEWNEQFPGPSL